MFSLFTTLLAVNYFEDVQALKSKGTYLSQVNSIQVCGDRLCGSDERPTPPPKSTLESYTNDATPSRGGDFTLEENAAMVKGIFETSDTEMIRPISDEPKEIRLFGSVDDLVKQNIVLSITKPDKTTVDLTVSVDNNGNFEANLDIKKTTPLGKYAVKAVYGGQVLGTVEIQINEHEVLSKIHKEKKPDKSFIKLSVNQITVPESNAQSQTIEITGFVANYTSGNILELLIVSPNNSTETEKIRATSEGTFSTFYNITPEFQQGVTDFVVKYLNKEVTRTNMTATSSTISLD